MLNTPPHRLATAGCLAVLPILLACSTPAEQDPSETPSPDVSEPGVPTDETPTITSLGNGMPKLVGTRWNLTKIGNEPVEVTESQRDAPHLVLDEETGRVSGSGGCNRLMGSFTLDGDTIEFGQMASTMMACPEAMDTEQDFHQALERVTGWSVEGETLELLDADGEVLLFFEASDSGD